jgi:hypothetical protein
MRSNKGCGEKCYVWSTTLYGAETWTLWKAAQKCLESCEMCCYIRITKLNYLAYRGHHNIRNQSKHKPIFFRKILNN